MKNYILIIMMVVTIFLSGCNDSNIDDNKKNSGSGENNVVDNNDWKDNPNYSNKHEVNFYLFYSDSCSHCHAEREWISSVEEEYPYVNFIMYEVSEYTNLFETVTNGFKSDNEYVPVTIIGNNYMVGYSDTKSRKFIRYIEELSKFDNCDVVDAIVNRKDVDACMKINNQQ